MEYVTEPAARIPVFRRADVVVAGGGPAGLAAAIAAARQGADTVLVERYGFLGGMGTAGLVITLGGMFHDAPPYRQVVQGIPGELMQHMVDAGACESTSARLVWFEPEAMKTAADELVEAAGVTLLLHSYVAGPIVENGAVTGLMVENKDGRQAVLGKVVIDATGDGDVAARAGAPWEKSDSPQPMTMVFKVRGVRRPLLEYRGWPAERAKRRPESHEIWRRWLRSVQLPPKMNLGRGIAPVAHKFVGERDDDSTATAAPYSAEARNELVAAMREAARQGQIPNFFGPALVGLDEDEVWALAGHIFADGSNATELTRAEVQGRRDARRFLQFWRDNVPAFRDSFLSQTGTQIGIRETRRIMGEYVLNEEEAIEGTLFVDAVALGCWPVDIHAPMGSETALDPVNHPAGLQQWRAVKAPYGIPYRCLVPRGIDGLLVAGRCISTTHGALASTRVMGTCMALGQAAGTAAAMAAAKQCQPRELDGVVLRQVLQGLGAQVG